MSQLKTIQDEHLPLWLPRLAVHGGPRFLQIADALQAAVADGSLRPGDRLPPQRHLAAQLEVDLTTITRAYDEARRRNLLEGRGARGTYVAAPKVELTAILDLSMNTPPPPAGVDFDDMLKQGLSALILALTEPGDVILAEPTSYPGLRAAAAQFGRHIIAVQADKHGMVPEMLEEACRQHKPRLIYLNPTLQNPTAITMPERRRKELASIAQRCDVRIVEDDPYWLLADAPPPPVATFAPEQVLYISTLSKCLTPGLRVAFVLIRDPEERERFLVALRSFALMVAPLTAALATQWILDGSADGLLEGVRKEGRRSACMDRVAGVLALFAACACSRQLRHRRHAGGGIRHWRRLRECHPDLPGQHQGPWTLAGGSSTAVSAACAAARVAQRCRGLTVRSHFLFSRSILASSRHFPRQCQHQFLRPHFPRQRRGQPVQLFGGIVGDGIVGWRRAAWRFAVFN